MFRRIALLGFMVAALPVACNDANKSPVEEGVLKLTVTTVPSDVQCLVLSVTGSTGTTVRSFSVTPGQSATLTGTGLPTGPVTITEAGYNLPCASVVTSSPPTWVATATTTATLIPGQPAQVAIELVPAGQATVTTTFNMGGAGGSTSTGGTGGAGSSGSTGGTGGSSSTGTGGNGRSLGCGKTPGITEYNRGVPITIAVGGQNRRYILQIPTTYDNTKAYTFILALHPRDGNDKSMYDQKFYGLLPLSNNNVIFAAPNGQMSGGTPCSGTGVGDSGCGWPSGNMPLMDAVVKQITDNFCVDTNRIYATGWSYGASMSYEIACQRPLGGPVATATWGVRAVATYSASQMSGTCAPSTSYPVAYYTSHGTNDNVLTYDGGINLAKKWATANGCAAFTPTKATSTHICSNATGCKTGYPTEVCSFVGGHTAYPDSGAQASSWGPAEVWNFFQQF